MSDRVQTGIISIAVVLIVFIVFGTFAKGCEQTEMTRREQIKLESERIKAGYEIERSQTTRIGTDDND
jgi:hypothetical protein